MLDLDSDLITLRQGDREILQAYLDAEARLVAERSVPINEEVQADVRSRWVERIREVEGVPRDRLAPIHGRLIALGFLQFQLQGRDAGVVYRVTTEGRAILQAPEISTVDTAPLRQSA